MWISPPQKRLIGFNLTRYIRSRYWFGWWWASLCSMHYRYDNKCGMCNAGGWTKTNHAKLFGRVRPKEVGWRA